MKIIVQYITVCCSCLSSDATGSVLFWAASSVFVLTEAVFGAAGSLLIMLWHPHSAHHGGMNYWNWYYSTISAIPQSPPALFTQCPWQMRLSNWEGGEHLVLCVLKYIFIWPSDLLVLNCLIGLKTLTFLRMMDDSFNAKSNKLVWLILTSPFCNRSLFNWTVSVCFHFPTRLPASLYEKCTVPSVWTVAWLYVRCF